MKKILILLNICILLTSCKKEKKFENGRIYPSPPSADFKLSWFEDFDSTALDLTKWDYRANGLRRQGWNSAKSIIIDTVSKNLIIRNVIKNDTAFTGMIGTQGKFAQKYGFFECRAKIPPIIQGYWPAFWIHSATFGKTLNPVESGTEMDIMEFTQGMTDRVNHAIHWNGYGPNLQSKSWETISSSLADGGFHTYALEWTPTVIKYYIDGRIAWEIYEPISGVAQYVILSCEIGDKKLFQRTFGNDNVDFIVDYIKVYEWIGNK